ncbi:N-acetyl-gamma-glutamyl-phosphate reductase [Cellulomonas sp. Root485]|uniref:N-acetyl-gamma-glutamyl-phosphate reductase n=1 Tax=Cellulomonas sp. Root485 TaxID=1736546 RepID=UPI00190FD900|nr:N-acetyl-gamma-glutamyl-phosphate reductase [Cellulomonas sp. Root485]
MTFTVAVAGASGYAGGEMLRVLLAHPEARIGTLTAHSNAGTPLGAHQPHLRTLADRVLAPTGVDELAGHDVVVLALPHGASGAIAAELEARGDGAIVVDLGADHRLVDAADWEQFYGSAHAGTWPYGLPELLHPGERTAGEQRSVLAGARRIAVPGCNVTAVSLGLQPGIAAGLIEPTDLVAVLANGYSGAGKSLKTHLLASEALGAAQPYAVGGTHRHIPEIAQNLRSAGAADVTISFTPTLVPMARGILATATARLAPGVDPADVRAAWEQTYADEPFVHLLPEGQWPTTAATLGANTALVQVAVDERAGRVVTVTAIDNLVKGTAGGALQSLNLALGLPETLGLPLDGVAP